MFLPVYTLGSVSEFSKNTLSEHLGIEFLEIGENYLRARMPVDSRTCQPFRILHGGASVALAETLGSIASQMTLDPQGEYVPVGLEINANHLKAATSGWVYGTVTPIHVGRSTHVWDIRITNESGAAVCASRLTVMIIKKS